MKHEIEQIDRIMYLYTLLGQATRTKNNPSQKRKRS